MTFLRSASLLAFSTALASCSPTDQGVGTTFSDSAGVRLAVAESPLWGPADGWRVTADPVLQIGAFEGPAEYLFSHLVGAVRLSDGRIVVADRGSADLRFFGPGGEFSQRVGGDGEGPGEFRRLEFIGLMQGDSLATYDGSLRRVQVFDPGGVLSRTFVVQSPWPTAMPDKVIGVVGGFLMAIRFIDFGTVVPNGIVRWPHELVATMDLRTGALDSIRMVPGSEASVEAHEGGGYSHGSYTFAKGNEFAAQADRMAIISTDTFSVSILGLDGSTELIVHRPVVPEAATEEHLRSYIEGHLALVFPEGSNPVPEDVENFRRGLLNTPSAATLPILRSVQLDSEGNIWVEMYFSPGEEPPPYQIFASDGTWLGEVAMPKGLDRGFIPYQAPSYQIGSDFILGVWKDELDVQYVRLYGLEKR